MNKEEYFSFHQACVDKMTAITHAKNADYTGAGDDPFANFARVEAMGVCSVEQGFLTRMLDKFCRLSSFVQQGTLQVKDESVEDTLLDLANYCLLLAGYIKSQSPKIEYLDPEYTRMATEEERAMIDCGCLVEDTFSTIAAESRAP